MKRSKGEIEYEIISQILISEVCFDICKATPIISGRGADFLPFYHNLCFAKGVITLHGLLLSRQRDELTIKKYLRRFGDENKTTSKNIDALANRFKRACPVSLRNKVCAHMDQGFRHYDFVSGYMIPKLVPKYIAIVRDLEQVFFQLTNFAPDQYPYGKILEQSKSIIETLSSYKGGN